MGGRDDRRSGDRVPINEEFAAAGSTWVSNLSLGGVFVHTDDPQPVGAAIELRFSLLLDDPVVIEARAKVVRHSRDPRGMGVQFTSLEPLMRARIEAVLEREQPVDSGAPLRLPEPSHEGEDDTTRRVQLARPAPVGNLRIEPDPKPEPDEDEPTRVMPGLSLPKRRGADADEPTTLFKAPPSIKKKP